MKRSLFPSRFGKPNSFTLVELLVVMGIIAILASVLFGIGGTAIRSAQRAKAQNMIVQLNTAVQSYYTEYSVYPIPTQATPLDVSYGTNDVTDWQNLIFALCGNVNPYSPTSTGTSTVANTRAISYLSFSRTDLDANGIPVNPISPNGNGNSYFNIAMDGNYDGILGNNNGVALPNYSVSSVPLTNIISGGVAVWANDNTSTSSNANYWVHAGF